MIVDLAVAVLGFLVGFNAIYSYALICQRRREQRLLAREVERARLAARQERAAQAAVRPHTGDVQTAPLLLSMNGHGR